MRLKEIQLAGMPKLNPNPPEYEPTGQYTQERKDELDKVHKKGFLWTEERKLIHHLMMEQNQAFAWDDTERGSFREDFFPPVVIPTVEHRLCGPIGTYLFCQEFMIKSVK